MDLHIPVRSQHGHKGTFGTTCVIGGCAAAPHLMLGGPCLAAQGSLRAGCGLSLLAVHGPLVTQALAISPESTGLALPVRQSGALDVSACAAVLDEWLPRCRCIVIGPGLGTDPSVGQLLVPLISQDLVPVVIDADAINALARLGHAEGDLRASSIWTPHPGEFERIANAVGVEGDPTDDEARPEAAASLARRLGCVVVLKGPKTIVTDGLNTHINTTGNACLATGGTGDVLAGVIGGLVAQFHKPHLGTGGRQITPDQQGGLSLLSCASIGVHIHGAAADAWAAANGDAGMTARDLLEAIPAAMQALRQSGAHAEGDG